MEVFDILEDLSDNLGVEDFYNMLMVNDLTYELEYKIVRRIEYYYNTFGSIKLHEKYCYQDEECFCIDPESVTEYISFFGDLGALKWFQYNKKEMITNDILNCASAGGHLDVMKWLHDNNYKKPVGINYACANGYFDIVKWAHDNRLLRERPDEAMDWVARRGFLDIAKWLYDNYDDIGCSEDAFIWSSMNGHLAIIVWLCYNIKNLECPSEAMDKACENGHETIADFLHDKYKFRYTNQYSHKN